MKPREGSARHPRNYLPVFPVTSMEAAIALSSQFTSTDPEDKTSPREPPATYLFGNASEARYLSLFVPSNAAFVNEIPLETLYSPLPLLPIASNLQLYSKPSPVRCPSKTKPSPPSYLWKLPKDQLLHSITTLVEAELLNPPAQKSGAQVGFFGQGALTGLSHLLAVIGAGGFTLWLVWSRFSAHRL